MQTNLEQILAAAEPTIKKLLEITIKAHKESTERNPTEYELEYFKLGFVVDLLKAVGNYIKPDDIVIVKKISNEKNVVVIYALVNRNGENYELNTEMIYAGGYNVQCRHLRYLVKTKLPKINNTAANFYLEKIKSLKKSERTAAEIERITVNFNREILEIERLRGTSDTDLVKTEIVCPYNYGKYLLLDFAKAYNEQTEEAKEYFSPKYFEVIKQHRTDIILKNKYHKINQKRVEKLENEYKKNMIKLKNK